MRKKYASPGAICLMATLLTFGAAAQAVSFSYTGPPVAIPDGQDLSGDKPGARVGAPITVSGVATPVGRVTLSIDGTVCTTAPGATTVGLDHSAVGDLQLTLRSPAGTEALVIQNNGNEGSNFCQVLLDDDSAGPPIFTVTSEDAPFTGSYTPARTLWDFNRQVANGEWTLFAQDFYEESIGSIRAWTLNITPVANPDVALQSSLNPSAVGAQVSFTATISGVVPRGFADFSNGTIGICNSVPVQAGGVAICRTDALRAGNQSITVTYNGDRYNNPATSAPIVQKVNPAATSVTVSAPASGTVGQPVLVTATLASTPVASFYVIPRGIITVSTSNGVATCTIALPATTCSLTPTGPGTQLLTASYAGDENFTASSGTQSIAIAAQTQAQTIGFTSTPPASPAVGGRYLISATATSGLPVSFAIDPTSTAGACTISGNTVSFSGPGTCVIAASQAGSGDFAAAPTVRQSVAVAAALALATPVPTLSQWALLLLAAALGWLGLRQRRRLT